MATLILAITCPSNNLTLLDRVWTKAIHWVGISLDIDATSLDSPVVILVAAIGHNKRKSRSCQRSIFNKARCQLDGEHQADPKRRQPTASLTSKLAQIDQA